ncbi:MAG: ABC transporter [Gammaproteobacteria bacterium]|nr:MAG: ABC transporter [Gammaproteobacteria bacterium]
MSLPVIAVEGLSKTYGSVAAVSDLSFNIARGSITALLGGNGAGKTTTLSMLLGLLLPTRGSIHLFGVDMANDRFQVLPRINFSSPYVDLPQRLTITENLRVYARLYGVVNINERIDEMLEALDLQAMRKRRYGTLSAGQKTRVAIAKAMLNEPELLLLDEPTASLDPDSADRIRRYLTDYKVRTHATILLASHNMGEVEQLCDDVIMLHRGGIVARGTPAQLIADFRRDSMEQVFIDITRETIRFPEEGPIEL